MLLTIKQIKKRYIKNVVHEKTRELYSIQDLIQNERFLKDVELVTNVKEHNKLYKINTIMIFIRKSDKIKKELNTIKKELDTVKKELETIKKTKIIVTKKKHQPDKKIIKNMNGVKPKIFTNEDIKKIKNLRFNDELSYQKIAKIMKCSKATVSNYIKASN